jgi:hypothetical protein
MKRSDRAAVHHHEAFTYSRSPWLYVSGNSTVMTFMLLFCSFIDVPLFCSNAFAPIVSTTTPRSLLKGYLDDLSSDLYGEVDDPDMENQSHEDTDAKTTDRVSIKRNVRFSKMSIALIPSLFFV